MPHAHENRSRRTQVSSVPHIPPPAGRGHGGKLAMVLGVALSMLVIVGLYAASFRYNTTFQEAKNIPQRWSVLNQEFSKEIEPLKMQFDELGGLKETLTSALDARASQAEALKIMKDKLRTATGTPPTGTPPTATPPTGN
jgi:hypothetical protein